LGKVPDASQLVTNAWQRPGHLLVQIGPRCESAAGTAVSRVLDLDANDVDAISRKDHLRFLQALEKLVAFGVVKSGVPFAQGGLLTTVFLTGLASVWGAEIDPPEEGWHALLQEHRCGAIIEISDIDFESLYDAAGDLRRTVVGEIIDEPMTIRIGNQNILTEESVTVWRSRFTSSLP
jgi:phosphoribosylformylglycinamidine (FGAM) synthase-like enzyme